MKAIIQPKAFCESLCDCKSVSDEWLKRNGKYMLNQVTVVTIEPAKRLQNWLKPTIKYLTLVFWSLLTLFLLVLFWDAFFNGSRVIIKLIIWSWDI